MAGYVEDCVHEKGWALGRAYSSYHGRVHIPNVCVKLKLNILKNESDYSRSTELPAKRLKLTFDKSQA